MDYLVMMVGHYLKITLFMMPIEISHWDRCNSTVPRTLSRQHRMCMAILYCKLLFLHSVSHKEVSDKNVPRPWCAQIFSVPFHFDHTFVILVDYFALQSVSLCTHEVQHPYCPWHIITRSDHFSLSAAFTVQLLLWRLSMQNSPSKWHCVSHLSSHVIMNCVWCVDSRLQS